MNVTYAREPITHNPAGSLFLMGPTPRSSDVRSWRPEALRIIGATGFQGTVYVPEDRPDADGVTRFRGNYDDQVNWEHDALTRADVILAYVPRDMATLPGLRTNVEWGIWQTSGKIVLGVPEGSANNRSLIHDAARLGVPVATNLPSAIDLSLGMLAKRLHVAESCVFCRIVHGDPREQVEQSTADSIIITPLGPVTPGHKLVIPRVHVADATTDPTVTAAVMRDAATYAAGVGDCNLITSVGAAATQTVFHLHVHVVPRVADDGLTLPWSGQKH